jgi:hypothetical protein
LRSIAYLMRHGVPLSTIEDMDEADILAWTVAIGESEGGQEYDFTAGIWRERER